MGNNSEMYAILVNGVRGFGLNSSTSGQSSEASFCEGGNKAAYCIAYTRRTTSHWLIELWNLYVLYIIWFWLLINNNVKKVLGSCDCASWNVGWGETNQQDATNLIIRRTRPCITAYAVTHGLVLLMMGLMMPETCWDRSLMINIGLVASCWFISPRPMKWGVCH